MNQPNLFNQVESVRFSVYVNVVSGFSVLQMALADSEVLKELIAELQDSTEGRQKVFQRLVALLKQNDQPEYAHPHDAAIAGYLYTLSQVDSELTQQAAEHILQTPQLWWARRLAKHIQEGDPITPPAEEKHHP